MRYSTCVALSVKFETSSSYTEVHPDKSAFRLLSSKLRIILASPWVSRTDIRRPCIIFKLQCKCSAGESPFVIHCTCGTLSTRFTSLLVRFVIGSRQLDTHLDDSESCLRQVSERRGVAIVSIRRCESAVVANGQRTSVPATGKCQCIPASANHPARGLPRTDTRCVLTIATLKSATANRPDVVQKVARRFLASRGDGRKGAAA